MNVFITPGFLGHPGETIFKDLQTTLEGKGHYVIELAWPHFADDLQKYSFSETIAYARTVIADLGTQDLAVLGFSMGGIIATVLAAEFNPARLGLIVSPYHVGKEEDLAGKYTSWQQKGYRDVTSSVHGELHIPFSFVEDAQKYNALDYIAEVHCPVLFVVGELDDKNPPSGTRALFDKANEPKSWHEIPGMQHRYQYQSKEMLDIVNDLVVNFIGS